MTDSDHLEEYLKIGLCDGLEDPERFMEYMSQRHWTLFEYYLAGIQGIENWYGDKSHRKYGDWFDILDATLLAAENHFMGRFGKE
jgi:hypothetical protein